MSELAPTDPLPFIILAYTIGLGGMLGFTVFTLLQRRKLRSMIGALRKGSEQ